MALWSSGGLLEGHPSRKAPTPSLILWFDRVPVPLALPKQHILRTLYHQPYTVVIKQELSIDFISHLYNRAVGDEEDAGDIEDEEKHDELHPPVSLVGHHDEVDQDDGVGKEGEEHYPYHGQAPNF